MGAMSADSVSKNQPPSALRRPSGAEEGEAAHSAMKPCGRRGGGSASPTNQEAQSLSNSCSGSGSVSKNQPPSALRRPSGAEEGEAACRGRRGGGSASPTNQEAQSLSNSCSGSESHRRAPGWRTPARSATFDPGAESSAERIGANPDAPFPLRAAGPGLPAARTR